MKITLLTGKTFDFSKEFPFDVKVKKTSVAKKLVLRIDTKDHCAILSIPKYCLRKQALKFLQENEVWIINTLANLPKLSNFADGDEISVFGKIYKICHENKHKGTRFEGDLLKVGGDKVFLHRRVKDFLKKEAVDKLAEISIKTAEKIGVKIASVTVKDTKSRWGSCSTKGNINYNWRIVLAPKEVIDYLVCHEVSHLKHPNHSTDFWSTVESLCPSYKDSRNWLKTHGKELYKYN
ncbi:MAG: M48 family metallopeptidase [Alphaproteobacteria bacterium]|nr:M48 family metallopeptidase [Alphaproteobacteria bacterium]